MIINPYIDSKYPLAYNPLFWLDATSKTYFSSSDDNLGYIVNTGTGRDGSIGITAYGTVANKPSYNGEGYYFNTSNAIKAGATNTFNHFHNGGQFTIYFLWKQLTMSNTQVGYLFTNNNGTGTNIGLSVSVDNRSSSSRTNAIVVSITNGTTSVVFAATNNAVTQNAYNWGKITYDGTNVRVYTNGTLRSTTAPGASFSLSNASNVMHIGATSTLASGANIYLKHIMMYNSLISAGDQTLLESWINAERYKTVDRGFANIYLIGGQSNASGRGSNAAAAAELNGKVGAKIFKLDSASAPTSASHWDELQMGVNQTTENVGTMHGFEMRFGYALNNISSNVYIIKWSVGGTSLAANADSSGDWNVSSTGELYDKFKTNVISNAMREMEHVLRMTPVFRGFVWMQGESDSISGRGASYKTNFTNMFNGILTHITSLGYSVNKLRLYIFRIKNGGSAGYDPTDVANVMAAQQDIGTNWLTDNPSSGIAGSTWSSTDAIGLQDTQHYNTLGYSIMGQTLSDYFDNYISE